MEGGTERKDESKVGGKKLVKETNGGREGGNDGGRKRD